VPAPLRYAKQSKALSALQNPGISSEAIEKTATPSAQKVIGQFGWVPSSLI
jgi:hypothetical protein